MGSMSRSVPPRTVTNQAIGPLYGDLSYVGAGLPGWSHWKDSWTLDFKGKDVILVLDADEAGQKGTADIATRFMRAGLPCPRQLVLPSGMDLTDYMKEANL